MVDFYFVATSVYSAISKISFNNLVAICWGAFLAKFLLFFILCASSKTFKSANKHPFFALVNIYTALTFATFLTEVKVEAALYISAIFWVAGCLLYGVLCLFKGKKAEQVKGGIAVISQMPQAPPEQTFTPLVPAAKSNVRLEHAASIVEKLLLKNLGRGDRMELEKLRQTLFTLQRKGSLTPTDGEVLNESFNSLLKLMAKYNL